MRQFSQIKPLFNYSRLIYINRSVQPYRKHHVNPWTDANDAQCEVKVGKSKLTFSSGKMARFADASAVAQIGDTAVMVTAVSRSTSELTASSFLPLTVDYRHKSAAAGRIPTTAARRETAIPSEKEILTSRIIDRSIRPLFPPGYLNDTHIMCNLLSWDSVNDPDIVALNATSAALALSNIPWHGPVGAVRIGCVDGKLVVNPSRKQLSNSSLNLVISSTPDGKVTMIDASADNIEVTEFKKAIQKGISHAQVIADVITTFASQHETKKRAFIDQFFVPTEIATVIKEYTTEELIKVFTDFTHHKLSRSQEIGRIRMESIKHLCDKFPGTNAMVFDQAFSQLTNQVFRDLVFNTDIRCDGRKLTELRPISCSVDLFQPLHGSAIFQRGQTQVFCTAALGSMYSNFRADAISSLIGAKDKHFSLHYEFPPYATNEVGLGSNVNRRELGHGHLAEKALRPVVPSDLQYTVRLTAEVFESNGSSSLASVCAGSLALMDAGVKITDPVAGVAIGLLAQLDETTKKVKDYRILTDILGLEDYTGDMDFKIAGTKSGITAVQADVKIPGLPMSIVTEAIDRGCTGIDEILGIMAKTLPTPRKEPKDNHPVIEILNIDPEKVPKFMGLGGRNVKKLTLETGVEANSVDGEIGKFELFAPDKLSMVEAKEKIKEMLAADQVPVLEFGAIYEAKIVDVLDSGIKVQIHNQLSPQFVHNSQLDDIGVIHPSALGLKIGQDIHMKYFGRDPADGVMRWSRKAIMSTDQGVRRALMADKKKQLNADGPGMDYVYVTEGKNGG